MELIPVNEFKFQNFEGRPIEGAPNHATLTCKNHPTARYSTKNPWQRGLHFLQAAEGFRYGEECECPFDDLVVIVAETE